MKHLTPEEQSIYNEGERLIPGVTHDVNETIRHRSSYVFFRDVIARDLASLRPNQPVTILDIGCGVGHGCATVAEISLTRVVGIDPSEECIGYAQAHYGHTNITYQCADLEGFASEMPEFDYVLSRGVLEHIPNGLELALRTRWRYRLMFDVPYNEPRGPNPYHVICEITEKDFVVFPNAELFFEDLSGVIYDQPNKPPAPNMIMCVCSAAPLEPVSGTMHFPVRAWAPPTPDIRSSEKPWSVKDLLRRLGVGR